MGKNHQIHLFLEKELKEALDKEAKDRNISISELCRHKLRQYSQLTRIEILLEKILKRGKDFGDTERKPKSVIRT